MRARVPLALGLALALVAAGVIYISVSPRSTSPILIDMNQVGPPPVEIQLPSLPSAIRVVNITGKTFCVYLQIPGGIVVDQYGSVWANVTDSRCFFRDRWYPYNDVYITFNGTVVRRGWDAAYHVVKPPTGNVTVKITVAYE